MVLPIHLLKLDPFPLYSRLLRYRVYSRQGYEKLRHDVPRQNYHAHVKVPPVVVVVFGGHEAAIDHGKIDGVLHLAHFSPTGNRTRKPGRAADCCRSVRRRHGRRSRAAGARGAAARRTRGRDTRNTVFEGGESGCIGSLIYSIVQFRLSRAMRRAFDVGWARSRSRSRWAPSRRARPCAASRASPTAACRSGCSKARPHAEARGFAARPVAAAWPARGAAARSRPRVACRPSRRRPTRRFGRTRARDRTRVVVCSRINCDCTPAPRSTMSMISCILHVPFLAR